MKNKLLNYNGFTLIEIQVGGRRPRLPQNMMSKLRSFDLPILMSITEPKDE